MIASMAVLRFSPSVMMLAPSCMETPRAERRLAALAHNEGRRVLVTALDDRNVAEAKQAVLDLNGHRGDRVDPGKRPGHSQVDAVGRGVDGAA